MPENLAAVLDWLIPAVVVFGIAALIAVISVWLIRRARRSPKARGAAMKVRAQTGVTLVELDDALEELEIEIGLSGALYGGDAPASLRRTRLNAQHVRDDAFAQFEAAGAAGLHPAEIRRISGRLDVSVAKALAAIARSRTEHAEWMAAHMSAADQVVAGRARLSALRAAMGDPTTLVASLSSRFDESEWQPAAEAARGAVASVAEAENQLAQAAERAADPRRSALPALAAAERSIRSAESDARTLEESHRLVLQAATALPDELAASRAAARAAVDMLEKLPAQQAERLTQAVKVCTKELDRIEADATRHPTRSINQIAHARDALDLAVGEARTAQQRLRNARTALPGTVAAARGSIARAEASVAHIHAGAEARSRLIAAQAELAQARQAADPVDALDAARRALSLAEDATVLVNYGRMRA